MYDTKIDKDGFIYGPISFLEWLGCNFGLHVYYSDMEKCLSCGKIKK